MALASDESIGAFEPVIVLDGELDLASTGDVWEAVRAELEVGAGPVVLDLQAVTFIDSIGVKLLLDVRKLAADLGRPLSFVRPSEFARRVLRLTGVDRVLGLEG